MYLNPGMTLNQNNSRILICQNWIMTLRDQTPFIMSHDLEALGRLQNLP